MISACPRCTLLGFAVSALVHLGIATAVLWRDEPEKVDLDGERRIAVSLAMFAGPDGSGLQAEDGDPTSKPEPEPVREPEPAAEPAPALAPDSEPELIPKATPLPKPEPKPEPRVKPKTAPKPQLKPAPKRKPKLNSKPASKPVSKTKPKTKPEVRPPPGRAAKRSAEGKKGGAAGGSKQSIGGGDKKNNARTKALEHEYLAGLRRAIAKKRRYPASAQRRGDTGVVTVSFVIAQNGRISEARVDKSSGSSSLDKAAVKTLQRLRQYKPIPKAIGRTRWSLRVPIKFALE